MQLPDLERITAFEHRFARAQATDIVELGWGYAALQADFPLSQYHNRIAVTSEVSGEEVLAATEKILVEHPHRYVSVDHDALGQTLRAALETAGYEHEIIAAMTYAGAAVGAPAHEVRAVSLDSLRPALMRDWRDNIPGATEELLRQLADRTELYARGADLTRLAVFEGDQIAAHADLYIDAEAGIAQFENLMTHPEFRRRGYGDALIRDAQQRGRSVGCDLSYLTVSHDDWPHEWYRRMGYADVGCTHHFSRQL